MMKEKVPLAVHILLDCSGSMEGNKGRAVEAMNAFTQALAMSLTPAYVTMSRFNYDMISPPMIDHRPVYELPVLTVGKFTINGGTNVYKSATSCIAAMDGVDAETKVMVVLTDGLSSGQSCKSLVSQRQRDGWLFVFLGMSCDNDGLGHKYTDAQMEEFRKAMALTSKAIGILPEHQVTVPFDRLAEAMEEAAMMCLEFKGLGHAEFKEKGE